MTPEEHLRRWESLHGVPASGLVRRWLRLVLVVSRPWVRLHPTAVTVLGVAVVLAALAVPLPVAAALVLLSGLLDGVDGCVAVLTDRVTDLGGRLDRLADRSGEVVLGALLWRAGVPAVLCAVAVALMLALELRRTDGPVRVTVAERPVRLLVVASALVTWPLLWAWVLVGLHVVGLSQLERERIVARS